MNQERSAESMNDRSPSKESNKTDPEKTDPVRDLLIRVGRRPEVPAEDAEIVRAAALEQWRQTVQEESRSRFSYRGITFLAAALIALGVGLQFLAPAWLPWTGSHFVGPVGIVEALDGRFETRENGEPLPFPQVGDTIRAGTVLETGSSRVALRMVGGTSLRLDHQTRVLCLTGSELILERGAVYADTGTNGAGSGGAGSQISIQTPWGAVRDIGTRFEVRLGESTDDGDPLLNIQVRDGEILLTQEASSLRAHAGQSLSLSSEHSVDIVKTPIHGDRWSWTEQILPPFSSDGSSLYELLTWNAYERGVELRFAGEILEQQARDVTVSGSVAGLSLDDAIDISFLGSVPWTYRVADGALWIEKSP